ncbi:PLP-dependent aminotransferase family protein [Microbacterium sp. SORGH_AS_0888]|uniref:aminotransferase-like domain-containing protein n=1 Tax=Microbacterium sp. SORGH_AS_0888 TaxID=3041791 RepID=UPI002785ADCA|nr:PLP-dependent aminotransferase family protein [Microbacterium sp. SORGH_AS_0888]MDQ1130314.1 DNA-binding transcriptional MocR family regulator [Microbacterium sp. SORGH_AS_0888]
MRDDALQVAHDGRAAFLPPATATAVVVRMRGRGARAVVAAIEEMIADGSLAVGQRLPSIRGIAHAAGMSPTTVTDAWHTLHRNGMLHTEGRRGTHVSFLAPSGAPGSWRLQRDAVVARDLSSGSPDPDLLPEVHLSGDELASLFRRSSYHGAVVEPELESAIRAAWGEDYRPERLTVVDGSLDAIDRLTSMLLAPGDVVIIEEPTYPPLWQMLRRLRCVARTVDIDRDGPRPTRLRLAMASRPRLFVYQPRAQNPTGASITPERLAAIAEILRCQPDTLVVELDSVGSVAHAPALSLADHLPDRVVRIHGFSKSHAPDLRLAAVGGPAQIIDRLEERRLLGPAWSSRALQHVLAHLLESPTAQRSVEEARTTYRRRSRAFASALRERGIPVEDADGLNVWVPVPDAAATLTRMARDGIAVASGAPFHATPYGPEYCRVTTAVLPEDAAAEVADILVRAVRADPGSPRLVN